MLVDKCVISEKIELLATPLSYVRIYNQIDCLNFRIVSKNFPFHKYIRRYVAFFDYSEIRTTNLVMHIYIGKLLQLLRPRLE